jgi:hypothetical protein
MGLFLFTTVSCPVEWVLRVLTMEVKCPGCEADCSPPSSSEVKNTWSCTSSPQYIFMMWCLIKQEIHIYGVALS